MEHSIPADAGAMIRDGIKSVAKQGACKEATWRYDPTPANPQTHLFPPNSRPQPSHPRRPIMKRRAAGPWLISGSSTRWLR